MSGSLSGGQGPQGPGVRTTLRRIGMAAALAGRAVPGHLAVFTMLSLGSGALPVIVAWLTKLVIDGVVGRAGREELIAPAAALAAVGLLAAAAPLVTQYLLTETDRQVGLCAQDRLFTAVNRFIGLERFENPRVLDRLRLAQQAGAATPGQVVNGVLAIARGGITIAGFLGSLYVLNPVMAGVVLVAGVPTLLVQLSLARHRAEMLWAIGPTERREVFFGQLLSTAEAAKEVRLFGVGDFLRERMLTDRRTANAARRALDRRQMLMEVRFGVLAAVVSGGGLLWAVNAAYGGSITVGDISVFIAGVAGVQLAVTSLAGDIARTHHALLMFDHYLAVTSAGPDLPVPASPRPLPPLRRGIELRDVWFRYSDQHPWVLRGVDLEIPHGTAVALVGRNGAGKSTIVKLLCRLYDPARGAVLWDGVDLRDADPGELRRRIGAVFQDYMHYDMTAAENIFLGDLDARDDRRRIQAAAERAGIHPALAALPRGYDTLLSRMFFMESDKDNPDTGVMLSGGQWQRLALARAFLRDRRDLMILDEPSAGLDAEAEHEIHTSLRTHREGRTSLLISHRLGAVRDADHIVVLADGRVAERGDHATLLAAGGQYARLFTMQASGYQPEDHDRAAAMAVDR